MNPGGISTGDFYLDNSLKEKFQSFFDRFFIKYCWTFERFSRVLKLGFCSQKMFVFALGESSGSCEKLISHLNDDPSQARLDPAEFFSLITNTKLVLSSSMIDELIKLGLDPQQIVMKTSVLAFDDAGA